MVLIPNLSSLNFFLSNLVPHSLSRFLNLNWAWLHFLLWLLKDRGKAMEMVSCASESIYLHTHFLLFELRITKRKLLKVHFMTFSPFQSHNFKNAPTNLFIFLKSSRNFLLDLLSMCWIWAWSIFLLLEIRVYNENADTASPKELLAGTAVINNVGNILHFKAITCSAIFRIAGPWRVGIRFLWQV
jgi:hypothetical protein